MALSGIAREDPGLALTGRAQALLNLLASRGALFTQELEASSGLLSTHLNMALSELIARGLLTCDSFGGLRRLLRPSRVHRRFGAKSLVSPAGRWSLLRPSEEPSGGRLESLAEFTARQLLRRYGILQRRLLERERVPIPWRDLARACRHLELRGEVRGGRFVSGLSGEQYSLPEAVELLRSTRKRSPGASLSLGASDPLNLHGILTPSPRISAHSRSRIPIAT
jgi:ATP-dependent Lhr-like helicase